MSKAFLPYRIGVASSPTCLQVRRIATAREGSFDEIIMDESEPMLMTSGEIKRRL
jgi:hypothetical protein